MKSSLCPYFHGLHVESTAWCRNVHPVHEDSLGFVASEQKSVKKKRFTVTLCLLPLQRHAAGCVATFYVFELNPVFLTNK